MLRLMDRLARFMAILGGLVLTALIATVCVSILGRGLDTLGHADWLATAAPWLAGLLKAAGPVTGDYELVEAGVAFAIFAFLPITQLHGGHATVDIFTSALPRRPNRVLTALWEIALSGAILIITWRLFEGLSDKHRYGETTFMLQFPVWWAYAASFGAACVASAVAVYCAVARVAGLITGWDYMPRTEGPTH